LSWICHKYVRMNGIKKLKKLIYTNNCIGKIEDNVSWTKMKSTTIILWYSWLQFIIHRSISENMIFFKKCSFFYYGLQHCNLRWKKNLTLYYGMYTRIFKFLRKLSDLFLISFQFLSLQNNFFFHANF
jgi:hypothetical protein